MGQRFPCWLTGCIDQGNINQRIRIGGLAYANIGQNCSQCVKGSRV